MKSKLRSPADISHTTEGQQHLCRSLTPSAFNWSTTAFKLVRLTSGS